jgi:H/ACA ribonucleoprotein complex subunit 2
VRPCLEVLPEAQKGGDKMNDEDAKEFTEMYGKVVSKIKSLD